MSIITLPPDLPPILSDLWREKCDQVEGLCQTVHKLNKEIGRWELAYAELWAGASKVKPEDRKAWLSACNYLAKLLNEPVPQPLKVRSPNPPRKKKQ